MKATGKYKRASIDFESGGVEITLSFPNAAVVDSIKKFGDKLLNIEIKPFRKARSLDANAYLWVLIGEIAAVLKADSDSIYEQMLLDYGTFVNIPIWKPELENEKRKHRLCVETGETVLTDKKGNEQTFVWCKCYRGSSEYDTAEMARLIDGVVSEAQELGIDTRTPKEIEAMKQAWKAQKK